MDDRSLRPEDRPSCSLVSLDDIELADFIAGVGPSGFLSSPAPLSVDSIENGLFDFDASTPERGDTMDVCEPVRPKGFAEAFGPGLEVIGGETAL